MIRIGVDVGGTNTDAVVMKNGDLLAGAKHPTSTDIISGVRGSATAAMIEANIQADHIDAFMIGTTHFVNALVERKNLAKVGLIRLCLPSGSSLPPFVDWPADLVEAIGGHFRLIDGGYEMDDFELPSIEQPNAIVGINLDGPLDEIMKSYESQILKNLYQSFPSSRKLAKRLNVSHTSIANKLRDYGIRKP